MDQNLERAVKEFDVFAKSQNVTEISFKDIKPNERILVVYGTSLEFANVYIYDVPSEIEVKEVSSIGTLIKFYSEGRYQVALPFERKAIVTEYKDGEAVRPKDAPNNIVFNEGSIGLHLFFRGNMCYASEKQKESGEPNFELAENVTQKVYRVDTTSSLYNFLKK